ncbi:MAG: methyltransferase domain-containing protein [Acidobacteria bacterium]|nr:methyltransferase domain-containing protein [Acidobacteriota bacterium]
MSAVSAVVSAILSRRLRGLESGGLAVTFPDGRRVAYGDATAAPVALHIDSWWFIWRVATGGDIGFAECFMRGEWRTDDLTALIQLFADDRDAMGASSSDPSWPRRMFERWLHWTRRNTPQGNRRNIAAHYDLGNEFFELFLDDSMTYSCGIFDSPETTLEQAQRCKIDAVIERAGVEHGDDVLEIGSGWGQLAMVLAREHACQVTTITQSEEQAIYVRALAHSEGLSDRIHVKLSDYRDIDGEYDRIVSVEMLEAVGHDNLSTYFEVCRRRLRAGGQAAIQVITIQDHLYDEYRTSSDFIRRYIFPGGHLPSLAALHEAIGGAGLEINYVTDIGPHYARTLREWRDRFAANADRLRAMSFDDRFQRTWEYYFAYCEAGFRAGMLGDLHIVLSRAADVATSRNRSAA